MDETLTAVFDGEVLRPDTPPDLEPNTRYVITVRKAGAEAPATDAWDLLDEQAGSIEAPEDWASEHDHYLYGTAKRGDEAAA